MRDSLKYDVKFDHLKYILFFFLFLSTINLYSQQPDTVVVYEYVYITDTIWIEANQVRDTNRFEKLHNIENAVIIIDTTGNKGDLLTFSSGKAATIPIKNIIMKEKRSKITTMKKLTFFGLTFLAMNSSLFAQPKPIKNIGIYLRGNYGLQTPYYNEIGNSGYYTSAYEGTPYEVSGAFGINATFPISSSFSLVPRISYTKMHGLYNDHYLGMKSDVDRSIVWGNSYSYLLEKGYTDGEIYKLYSKTDKPVFYFLATDLLLNYKLLQSNKVDGRIYGGLRVDCLVKQLEGLDLTDANYSNFESVMFNYVGGIGIDFWKRIFLEIEYSNHINNFVNTKYMSVKYGAASMNIGCYLF